MIQSLLSSCMRAWKILGPDDIWVGNDRKSLIWRRYVSSALGGLAIAIVAVITLSADWLVLIVLPFLLYLISLAAHRERSERREHGHGNLATEPAAVSAPVRVKSPLENAVAAVEAGSPITPELIESVIGKAPSISIIESPPDYLERYAVTWIFPRICVAGLLVLASTAFWMYINQFLAMAMMVVILILAFRWRWIYNNHTRECKASEAVLVRHRPGNLLAGIIGSSRDTTPLQGYLLFTPPSIWVTIGIDSNKLQLTKPTAEGQKNNEDSVTIKHVRKANLLTDIQRYRSSLVAQDRQIQLGILYQSRYANCRATLEAAANVKG